MRIPDCPVCGKPLDKVSYNVYETWLYDEDTGTYRLRDFGDMAEVKCPHCESDLSDDMFQEGPANFKMEESDEQN